MITLTLVSILGKDTGPIDLVVVRGAESGSIHDASHSIMSWHGSAGGGGSGLGELNPSPHRKIKE